MNYSGEDYLIPILVVGAFWLRIVVAYGIRAKLSRAFMAVIVALIVLALFAG